MTNNFASKFRRVVDMSCPENAQDWPMCAILCILDTVLYCSILCNFRYCVIKLDLVL